MPALVTRCLTASRRMLTATCEDSLARHACSDLGFQLGTVVSRLTRPIRTYCLCLGSSVDILVSQRSVM